MQVQSKKKSIKKQQYITHAMIRRQVGQKSRGIFCFGQYYFYCALGKSGISSQKREGDGATPLTTMKLLGGFRRNFYKPMASSPLYLRRIRKNDGWCDAVGDANYNRPVRLPYAKSAEKMHRDDHLYDIGLIPDWNIRSRGMNMGSAIFIHLARENYLPTEGCIALSRRDMERLLPYFSNKTKVQILR